MSFTDIDIKPEYRSRLDNVIKDFYIPVLKEAVLYKRAVEEASYGLMPLDYISKSLSSDIPLSRDEIKNMIRDNLLYFELMYGDDYVEPQLHHSGWGVCAACEAPAPVPMFGCL